jgi:tight adherence protein B
MSGSALVVVGTFVLVVLLIVGPYYFVVMRPETASREMLQQRIRTGGSAGSLVRPVRATLLKEVERISAIRPLNQLLSGESRLVEKLRAMIRLSNLNITPGQLVLGSACLVLAGYLAVIFWWLPNIWLAAGVGAAAGFLPFAFVRFTVRRRLHKFEEHFPEAVDLIARTLRAGHAFTTGLRLASEELPAPLDVEFKLLYEQQNYGMSLVDALKGFAQRIPIMDSRFFVTAVLTQREAGGNLAEVLDNLGAVIRERFRIKRQLRVVTAHGRMTGIVLAMLPPALASYMFFRQPEHFDVLVHDPSGQKMLAVAVGLQALGAFLIMKISNVEY